MNKLLLSDRQVSKLLKAFANNSSANIKFAKAQLSNIAQLRGFLNPPAIAGILSDKVTPETVAIQIQ